MTLFFEQTYTLLVAHGRQNNINSVGDNKDDQRDHSKNDVTFVSDNIHYNNNVYYKNIIMKLRHTIINSLFLQNTLTSKLDDFTVTNSNIFAP